MTFEALAPMLISYIMVAVVITNTTVIVEAIIGMRVMPLNKWPRLWLTVGQSMIQSLD